MQICGLSKNKTKAKKQYAINKSISIQDLESLIIHLESEIKKERTYAGKKISNADDKKTIKHLKAEILARKNNEVYYYI